MYADTSFELKQGEQLTREFSKQLRERSRITGNERPARDYPL